LQIPSYRTEIAHAAFLAARGALYHDFKKKLLILDLDRATMEEEALREQLHNEFIPIRIGTNNENTRFIPPKALIQRVNQLLPPVSQELLFGSVQETAEEREREREEEGESEEEISFVEISKKPRKRGKQGRRRRA
jgi:hypothetical protein